MRGTSVGNALFFPILNKAQKEGRISKASPMNLLLSEMRPAAISISATKETCEKIAEAWRDTGLKVVK